MPNNVLTQLKTLRDGVAEELRRDPRYQTLQALDKSIAEITNVLAAAGLLPPGKAASSLSARLSGLGPSLDALAEPAAGAPQQQISAPPPHPPQEPAAPDGPGFTPAPHAAPVAPAATETTPGFKDGTVSQAQAAVPESPSSLKPSALLKPAAGLVAALIAGGVAAEAVHEHAKAKPAEPEPSEAEKEAEAEEHAADAEPEDGEAEHDGADDGAATQASREPSDPAGVVEDEAESEKPHEPPAKHGLAPVHVEAVPPAAATGHPPADGHDAASHASGKDESDGTAGGETPPAPDPQATDDGATDDGAAVVPKGKASGYIPMAAKAGAPQYAPSIAVKFGKLPNKVDLRPLMTPVEDQGETSSCVANAVAGAYEYWIKKASKKDQNISRLFVYYNARWRDGSQDEDGGSVIQLAMEGLQKFGACAESVWPFDARLVLQKPGAEAYENGAPYRVHDMAQVPLKLESWKQALAEGKPVVFGIELFESFDECTGRGGVVPMPAPDDLARRKHSGHSMCAVGYSESEKVFIVRNSWGAGFGDKGYCYMPYDYVLNPKFNDADCWVFVPKVPSQPPRETWQDNTTPVTNGGQGVDFEIQPYRIADYERIAIDLFAAVRRPWNGTIVAEYGDYVSAVSKNLFTELQSFDVRTFLTSTAVLAGVGVSAAAISGSFSSESSSSESVSERSVETSESASEEDAEEDAEDEAEDSEDDTKEDEAEEDAEDESADDDADADEEDDGDKAADGEKDGEDDDDESEDEEDEEADDDEADDEAGGGDEGGDDEE